MGSTITMEQTGHDMDTTCIHHWDIEPPRGSQTVEGVCRLCKARKTFLAGFDETAKYTLLSRTRAEQARKNGRKKRRES